MSGSSYVYDTDSWRVVIEMTSEVLADLREGIACDYIRLHPCKHARGEEEYGTYELVMKTKNGETIYTMVGKATITDAEGRALTFVPSLAPTPPPPSIRGRLSGLAEASA